MDLLTILAGIILVIIFVGLLVALLRVGFRLLRYLIPNAIFGLIILAGANLVGIGVPIDWITVGFSASRNSGSYLDDLALLDRCTTLG